MLALIFNKYGERMMDNKELVIRTYKRVNGKKEISKVHKSTTYDINFGIVEDVAEALESVTMKSSEEDILKVILKNIKNVKPLLFDVFDGLTDEELRTVNTKEVINVIYAIITYAINELNSVIAPKN